MDRAVIRIIQAIEAFFFTFVVFLWFGGLSVLLLAVWYGLTVWLTHDAGAVASIIWTFVALAVVGGLVYYMARIPHLINALFDIGMDISRLGMAHIHRLERLANELREHRSPSDERVEIKVSSGGSESAGKAARAGS